MIKTIHLSILMAALGLIFGSFFSVVIDRSQRDESVVFPRSHCPHCQKILKVQDLIPLLSYLLLRGKCRNCKKQISLLYPITECVTAMGFSFMAIKAPTLPEILIGCGLFSLLLIVTMTDLQAMIIPDKVIIAFTVYFLLLKIWHFSFPLLEQDFKGCFLGLLCPLCVWLMFRGGIGFGDVKLFGLLGFVLGPEEIFHCILLSCLMGLFGFLGYFSYNQYRKCRFPQVRNHLEKSGTKMMLPFAPFISIGALIVYFLE